MNMTAGSKGILMGCVAGALTVLGQPAWPAIVTWTGGNGHWADIGAPGWDSAEPDATDDAYVNTGATVTIDQSGERAKNLTLGVATTDSGALNIIGGTLTVEQKFQVATAGSAAVTQSGGVVTTANNYLSLSNNWQGTGVYTLSDGVLNTAGRLDFGAIVGHLGTGVFNLEGGDWNSGACVVWIAQTPTSSGTINMSGGTLSTTKITIGEGAGFFNFTGGALHAGTVDFDLDQQGGILAPGESIGMTQINGDYNLGEAGIYHVEINGFDQGDNDEDGFGYDFLNITGAASLKGTLQLSLLSFTPELGDSFDVLTAANIDLTGLELAGDPPGMQHWSMGIVNGGNGEILRLNVVPEPATILLLAAGLLIVMPTRRRGGRAIARQASAMSGAWELDVPRSGPMDSYSAS